MRDREPLTFQTTLSEFQALPHDLQEIEQVRAVLNGDSVIDWRRLAFRSYAHVEDFLAVAGFDLNLPGDRTRFATVHARALEYIRSTFPDRRLHHGVVAPDDVRDLFLLASDAGPARGDACMLLKVMHVVHHVGGRDLLFRMPVALSELFHRVETRVFDAVDGLKARGVRVVEFAGSRKTADSILTKLLARRESLAAEVHDRLRFRVVTQDLHDLFRTIVYLTGKLFPFNYVVPGSSRNDLIDFQRTIQNDPALSQLGPLLQSPIGPESDLNEKLERTRENLFSAATFRMINFVVDMPVRVDDLVRNLPNHRPEDGTTVFVLVEFQLVDEETDRNNNTGPNAHSLYKQRQHDRVLERIG